MSAKQKDFLESYIELYGSGKGFKKSQFYDFYQYTKNKEREYTTRTKDRNLKNFSKSKERDALRKMTYKYNDRISTEFYEKQLKSQKLTEVTSQPYFVSEKVTRTPSKNIGKAGKQIANVLNTEKKPTIYTVSLKNESPEEFNIKDRKITTQDIQRFQKELNKVNNQLNKLGQSMYENSNVTVLQGETDDFFFIEYNYEIF